MTNRTWVGSLRAYEPIVLVLLGSTGSFVILVLAHRDALTHLGFGWAGLGALLLGMTYTHFFEYAYHRFLMHSGAPRLDFIKRSHLEHHRVFNGRNFTSRNETDLQHIASHWLVFPMLFTLHYLALRPFVAALPLLTFLFGVLLHYLFFELTHWFTHVEANGFDRALRKAPLLGALRKVQIRHHRQHHDVPVVNFNFNPPFLGDAVARTLHVPPVEADSPVDLRPIAGTTGDPPASVERVG